MTCPLRAGFERPSLWPSCCASLETAKCDVGIDPERCFEALVCACGFIAAT